MEKSEEKIREITRVKTGEKLRDKNLEGIHFIFT
jgi:hypothetical protein